MSCSKRFLLVIAAIAAVISLLTLPTLVSAIEERVSGDEALGRTTTYLIDNDGGVLYTNECVGRAGPAGETNEFFLLLLPDFSALRLWGIDEWYFTEPELIDGVEYPKLECTEYLGPSEVRTDGWEYYTYYITTYNPVDDTWTLDMTPWSYPAPEVFTIFVKLPPYATATSVSPTPIDLLTENSRQVYKFEQYNVEEIRVQITYTISPPAASMVIRADSPVNILVTSPYERRVGYNPTTGEAIIEIPGATYSGPGTEPQIVEIPTPTAGTYIVDAYAFASGPYTIIIQFLASDGSTIDTEILTGTAVEGDRYAYTSQMSEEGSLTPPTPPPGVPEFSFSTALTTSISTVLCLLFGRRKLRRKK